jgi:maltooligosyltrehalose trehalohydrolase
LFTTRREPRAAVRIHGGPRPGSLPAPGGATRAAHADADVVTIPLEPVAPGVFAREVEGLGAGALYTFVLDGRELPDPYARFLPYGVHGPARVEPRIVAPRRDGFVPPPFERWVIYELHVGTFTPQGTYAGVEAKLDHLVDLGVNAIELMPIASFVGSRGWGYDGVALFAPHAAYGDPADLRRLVRAAHDRGIAMILDVVYNHFGPTGNYLSAYAPEYLTSAHQTAWGDAPSFGDPRMRRLVLDNARYWLEQFDFDALRLDATHGIFDDSPEHVLAELARVARSLDPPRVLVAEDERNLPELVTEHGLDGIWADDFHHALRVTLTGERDGYYAAYRGGAEELARVIERGWLYEGQRYEPTGQPRGKPATLPKQRLVHGIQNHDQIGNRAFGERLSVDVSLDAYLGASALLLFLPRVPLLFMGQEWAASTPFLYFTDHEPEIGEAVTRGRREELGAFRAFRGDGARGPIPDPQALDTFERSRLAWREREREPHARCLALYRRLLELRARDPVLSRPRGALRARVEEGTGGALLVVTRADGAGGERVLLYNTSDAPVRDGRLARGFELLVATSHVAGDAMPARAAAVLAPR